MDIQDVLRSIVTLLAFVAFIGIVVWAWSGARRKRFAEAARIPFEEDGVHSNADFNDSINSESTNSQSSSIEKTGTDRNDTNRIDVERSGQ